MNNLPTDLSYHATMSTSDSANQESWISSFCSLLGHEYFAEVSEDFIEDDFNLTGLQSQVPMYKEALEMILDVEPEEDDEEDEEDEDEDEDDEDGAMRDEHGQRLDGYGRRRHARMASDLSVVESSAELLYGLIHQRYITSRPGIQQMAEKYDADHFGHCPRVFCNGAKVLPVGCHDTPGVDTVKLFCPSCCDVYTPPNSRFQSVDGAFFGTTFGCLFFMTFPEFDIAPKGDPLGLSATHPIFGHPAGATAATASLSSPTAAASTPAQQQAADRTKSRSSSLTSNQPPMPTGPPPIPPEYLPPAGQPTHINGVATTNLAPGLGPGRIHEPRIYGFKVSERARTGPRMKWLRMRPVDITELDEVKKWEEEFGSPDAEAEAEAVAKRENGNGNGNAAAAGAGPPVPERRKKAAPRRRRVGPGKADVMDTNGVGGGG